MGAVAVVGPLLADQDADAGTFGVNHRGLIVVPVAYRFIVGEVIFAGNILQQQVLVFPPVLVVEGEVVDDGFPGDKFGLLIISDVYIFIFAVPNVPRWIIIV